MIAGTKVCDLLLAFALFFMYEDASKSLVKRQLPKAIARIYVYGLMSLW